MCRAEAGALAGATRLVGLHQLARGGLQESGVLLTSSRRHRADPRDVFSCDGRHTKLSGRDLQEITGRRYLAARLPPAVGSRSSSSLAGGRGTIYERGSARVAGLSWFGDLRVRKGEYDGQEGRTDKNTRIANQ